MVDQFGGWRADYPGQSPWMDPQFLRIYGQQQVAQAPQQPSAQQQPQQQAPQTTMTRPTIHAEIIQVSNGELGEQEVSQYPVGAGQSQMFITQNESMIFVKEATPNGYIIDVYPKRPPAPQPPPFNPAEYVRTADLPAFVAAEVQAALAAIAPPAKTARTTKKEPEVTE